MLLNHMGRERTLQGIQAFIKEYHDGPDYPVLQDFLAVMRRFAVDGAAFDAFTHQWFFEAVVPEFRLNEASRTQISDSGSQWDVAVRVENAGTGRVQVDVAATAGERFGADGAALPSYQEARTAVLLGPGEAKVVHIRCDFLPDRVLVDPDALVLQLGRKLAVVRF
jgi:hypothetical protein